METTHSKTSSDNTTATGRIHSVSGLLVKARGMGQVQMYEVVLVSSEKLMGEVIELNGDIASIQVYEDTSGITPGDIVERTGNTMSVELGPGLLQSVYDGVQRPLNIIREKSGSNFIQRGIKAHALDREAQWPFQATVTQGDTVSTGDILGTVEETSLITHKIMVPSTITHGTVRSIKSGTYTIEDTIATIETDDGTTHTIQMLQRWPIRTPRPKHKKFFPDTPLMTGVRSIDSLFPIAKGGAGAVPGPFGSGKSVIQQSLAKYCDAQVIIYIGCGERGNEITEALEEFPELTDPNTGDVLMKRTILIANTSNMPVAAREASIYTGVTLAEYYRDMGYSVALMADSTSRWAEAMREISGRLEEMPGEEGYPAYLASKTSAFYERAGYVRCLGSDERNGALTIIGAVSPPGGDLSEPVSQATLRVTKTYWGLDSTLAYKKHFPSINWLSSYSLYVDNFLTYWREHIGEDFEHIREKVMKILQEENRLNEIVQLVGMEALSAQEKVVMEIARTLREDFLFQNAFDSEDAYTPLTKQYQILKSITSIYDDATLIADNEAFDFAKFRSLSCVKDIATLKEYAVDDTSTFDEFRTKATQEIQALTQESEGANV